MVNIRKNLFYKGLLTFSNYIIGFITFPYITRILGPDNFGAVNFTLNTVDYFLLFASMGISIIGAREIASCRDNSELQNIVFSRIFGLNLIFTIVTLIIYYLIITYVERFHDIYNLMIVGGTKIFFTVFAVEWFFTGTENFKYITLRSLIIKICYVIIVFITVNKTTDSLLYLSLTVGSIILNSIINFIYVHRFVHIRIKECLKLEYFFPNMRMGIYCIMTSMYITFNIMYLGLVTSNIEVGYYSTAVKLYFIIISLFSAYTTVMLPRMTSLLVSDKLKYNQYLQRSFHIVSFIAIPIIFECLVLTPQIIYILSGKGYSASILPMRILMPALILVWYAQVIVFQGLVPLKKDKILFNASVIGGILSLILNLLFTKKLGAVGSAFILISCETIVTIYYLYIVYKDKLFSLPSITTFMRNILISLPYLLIAILSSKIVNTYIGVSVAMISSGILFILLGKKEMLRIKKLYR